VSLNILQTPGTANLPGPPAYKSVPAERTRGPDENVCARTAPAQRGHDGSRGFSG